MDRHTCRHNNRLIAAVVLAAVVLAARRTQALPRYGPLEIAGNISAQNLLRFNDNPGQLAFVQQRNTFKLRVDYQMFDQGKMMNKFDVPFIERGKLFFLYRGVYDSVYDSTPGFAQRNIYGNKVLADGPNSLPMHLSDFSSSERNALKFENQLREAYMDLAFKTVPLSLRLGRQQIVWGETDNFRLLDRVNALDLTWHLQQESWDELRIPYWMIKGLVDLDRVGIFAPVLSNTYLEFYWNPGDWSPSKKDFLPRPWSAPIVNPLTDPQSPPQGGRGLFNILTNQTGRPVNSLFKNTTLFKQGDYTRNPGDNSQVGVRFGAVTPQGVQFTLNYFYQRWSGGDDGTNAAAYTAIPANQVTAALKKGQAPIEAIFPYVNTVGLSMNYADEEYTQTVFRTETIYEFGVPFSDASKHYPDSGSLALLRNDLFGVSKKDMWNGSIAFDRPTWIRAVNRKSTVLILGQFFWNYLLNNPNILCADAAGKPTSCWATHYLRQIKGFRGQYSTSGITNTGIAGQGAVIDRVRDWEALVTLAATTFYSGGKIVPFLVYILDPVNSYNMEVYWFVDYYLTNDIILNLGQRYFINTVSHPVYETWGVGGTNRGRSETTFRVTYQF